jgi:hypothetical protein
MSLNLRKPTTAEIFSSTAKMQLLNKQSEMFVNETLKNGGVIKKMESLPTSLKPQVVNEIVLQKKMAGMYVGAYIKNNLPALAIVFGAGLLVSGAVLFYNESQDKSRSSC